MRKLKKVPTRGITTEELLALWREGKLYQEVNAEELSQEELLARCRQEALRYVAAVDEFVTEEWRPFVSKVWERVFSDKMFSKELVMRNKRKLNRYFLTSLVFNLQTRGVYYPVGKVSQLRLHLKLEGTDKKNSIYKNIVNYPVTGELRRQLSALLSSLK